MDRDVRLILQRIRETNLSLVREHGVNPEVIASSLLGLAVRMSHDFGSTRAEIHSIVDDAMDAIEAEPKE